MKRNLWREIKWQIDLKGRTIQATPSTNQCR